MQRSWLWILGGLGVGALGLGAACGSDDGNGGSTAAGTTTGAGGGCSCYSCYAYIAACLVECPPGDPRDLVCDSSLPNLNALNQCICAATGGDCEAACPATCSMTIGGGGAAGAGGGQGGAPVDTDQCMPCQAAAIAAQGPCVAAWDDCYADQECQ